MASTPISLPLILQAKKRNLAADIGTDQFDLETVDKKFKAANNISDIEIDAQVDSLIKEYEDNNEANTEDADLMSITLKELKQSVITTSNYKGYVLPDLAHTLFSFTIADLEKDISSQEMQKIMDDNMTTTKTTTTYGFKVFHNLYLNIVLQYFDKCNKITNQYVSELYKHVLEALCCTLLTHQATGHHVLDVFSNLITLEYERQAFSIDEVRNNAKILKGLGAASIVDEIADFENYFGKHAAFALDCIKPYFNLGSVIKNLSSLHENSLKRIVDGQMLAKVNYIPGVTIEFTKPFIIRIEQIISTTGGYKYLNIGSEDSRVICDMLQACVQAPKPIQYRDQLSLGSKSDAQMWCMLDQPKSTSQSLYKPKCEVLANAIKGSSSKAYALVRSVTLAPPETGTYIKTKLYPTLLNMPVLGVYVIDFDCPEFNNLRQVKHHN